ncbi:Dbl homology domain-containing protein [Mycena sanguinolenta]|nr:Dbl homology domain-containing protein [Mycena sanguinolenta]
MANLHLQNHEELRSNITSELMETERKYVRDLELMQTYATAVTESGLLSARTLYLLFSNLSQLLAFQRTFLSRLEATNNLAWPEQQWGRDFIEAEEAFVAAYEPWFVNVAKTHTRRDVDLPPGHRHPPLSNRILQLQKNIAMFDGLIHFNLELPAFIWKPIGRAYQYMLLTDSLLKVTSPDTYPHYAELQRGSAAAKRVPERLQEACRPIENVRLAEDLRVCVVDWQGHDMDAFGALLQDATVVVTDSGTPEAIRHVFLFEQMLLFCASAPEAMGVGLRYGGRWVRRLTAPLVLKRHIPVASIMQTRLAQPDPVSRDDSSPLDVWWEGDHGLEVFTLRFTSQDLMCGWETLLKKLIQECAERRAHERGLRLKSKRLSSPRGRSGFDSGSDDNLECLVEEEDESDFQVSGS